MSHAVWKFSLQAGPQVIMMPKGARVLHVHEQGNQPCVWALVDTEAANDVRGFAVIGTGNNLDEKITSAIYHGSARCGAFVWHVFEVPPRAAP